MAASPQHRDDRLTQTVWPRVNGEYAIAVGLALTSAYLGILLKGGQETHRSVKNGKGSHRQRSEEGIVKGCSKITA